MLEHPTGLLQPNITVNFHQAFLMHALCCLYQGRAEGDGAGTTQLGRLVSADTSCLLPCQVYKAVLRETGQEVAVKVQRPGVEPVILRDLFIFRSMARFVNPICK